MADPRDDHAAPVLWALGQGGVEIACLSAADLPHRGSLSLRYAEGRVEARAETPAGSVDIGRYGTVWRRRQEKVRIDPARVHPDDLAFAANEAQAASDGLRFVSEASGARWVNPMHAARAAANKPHQLALARAVGLRVPDTLISNDADDVLAFYRHHGGRVIYKPLTPLVWQEEDAAVLSFVRMLDEEAATDREAIAVTPGIYQAYVPKAYELRVTIMDRHVVAVRIDSQASDRTRIDWRHHVRDVGLDVVELPDEVRQRLFTFMDRLGLRFGALDLIVTPEGEHVILEVNEMGQFLWIDEACPQARLMPAFCAFLAHEGPTGEDRFEGTLGRWEDATLSAYANGSGKTVATINNKRCNL